MASRSITFSSSSLINRHLDEGGNLLWLHEPGSLKGLDKLAEKLKIGFVKGTVVDPTTQLLGISDPTVALVNPPYPVHPVTNDFNFMTLFPQAGGIHYRSDAGWEATQFLSTAKGSWSENSPLRGVVDFDEKVDFMGPLALGVALSKKLAPKKESEPVEQDKTDEESRLPEQRIVILGDVDFLSNNFLGNQGNQDMGHNILNWLSHDDTFIAIPAKVAKDTTLTLSQTGWSLIGLFFFIVLPVTLLGTGVAIWWRRRKR